jgi:hypothetical protein
MSDKCRERLGLGADPGTGADTDADTGADTDTGTGAGEISVGNNELWVRELPPWGGGLCGWAVRGSACVARGCRIGRRTRRRVPREEEEGGAGVLR